MSIAKSGIMASLSRTRLIALGSEDGGIALRRQNAYRHGIRQIILTSTKSYAKILFAQRAVSEVFNMVIDFHTHVFPDKIADKTVALLRERSSSTAYSDGKVSGLISRMAEAGVDVSVALPVLTSPAQFESVARFAAELNERFKHESRRIISFAGIHPDCEDIPGKMKYIKDSGFLGVKIHPDYQGTFIDDERYVEIVRCAMELDLIVVTHSGVDGAYLDSPVRCTPERALKLLRRAPHKKLVFAHLGASRMIDEVMELLAGEDVYFDTAYTLKYTAPEALMALIKKHGADRMLFATDSPWSSMESDLKIIRALGLSSEDEEKILSGNARKLLGI